MQSRSHRDKIKTPTTTMASLPQILWLIRTRLLLPRLGTASADAALGSVDPSQSHPLGRVPHLAPLLAGHLHRVDAASLGLGIDVLQVFQAEEVKGGGKLLRRGLG